MKKIVFVILFLMVFSIIYGQTLSENRWLIGRWEGIVENGVLVIIFNEDGTGRIDADDFIYFINGNILKIFNPNNLSENNNWNIYRISDNRMIINIDKVIFDYIKGYIIFNRKNE